MPTISESKWLEQKEKQDAIVGEFIKGIDTECVLEARLYGLGLRGDYLRSEVEQAVGRRNAMRKCRPRLYTVMVFERGRQPELIRFKDAASADNAVALLRRQDNIQLATKVAQTGGEHA